MTMPIERTRAVLQTEEFLKSLLDREKTPRIPKEIRQRALGCLRHYPSRVDLAMTANNYQALLSECPFAHPDEKF